MEPASPLSAKFSFLVAWLQTSQHILWCGYANAIERDRQRNASQIESASLN
jgi:hypothetical protein